MRPLYKVIRENIKTGERTSLVIGVTMDAVHQYIPIYCDASHRVIIEQFEY